MTRPILIGAHAMLLMFALTAMSFSQQTARSMRATVYADGKSCPNNCDAHVVFDLANNGTRNAFKGPIAARANPQKCVNGEQCTICFDNSDNSCMSAVFRGSGPHSDAFDFTPAFLDENCPKSGNPSVFATMCRKLEAKVKVLNTQHLNCFSTPEHVKCAGVMAQSKKEKDADEPFYLECRTLGQKEFNRKYKKEPLKLRRHDCAYSDTIRKKNTEGKTWVVLMPAACPSNSYVGKDGLDCCTGSAYATAGLAGECMGFYPKK